MIEIKDFTPRQYQKEIFETSKNNNLLAVLPTGVGKTFLAVLLAVNKLNKEEGSKVIIVAPSKPLCAQHHETFINHTNLEEEDITLLTGAIQPKKRQEYYEQAKIIVATPQTIKQDLINERLTLKYISALIIDEAHKSVGNYAYTFLSKNYIENSKYPIILALTASPGGTKSKIDLIKENLSIDKVEIRTEHDIHKFIQEKEITTIEVELTPELKALHDQIKIIYKSKLKEVRKIGLTKPTYLISKGDLLKLQFSLRKKIKSRNQMVFYGLYLTALLIKLDYCLELIETQGVKPLQQYWNKLQQETSKAASTILNINEIQKAILKTNKLVEKGTKHPKLFMLRSILKKEIKENSNSKIIVFANYRNTIDEIVELLNLEENIKATKLIGQKSGLTQKEQIATIKEFEEGKYNVIIGTSISEEGLSISGATIAIQFDQGKSSEIRTIQRMGRVGRVEAGKVITLLTKNTREIGYYYASKRKEKVMQTTLKKIQETPTTLNQY